MRSFLTRGVSALGRRRRSRSAARLQVENLESRALMTLTGLSFNATITSTPVATNGALYFRATDATHHTQLWKSDGTASGTVMLTNIHPSVGLNPTNLTAVGNTLYFSASDGVHGFQLWKSDGTPSG